MEKGNNKEVLVINMYIDFFIKRKYHLQYLIYILIRYIVRYRSNSIILSKLNTDALSNKELILLLENNIILFLACHIEYMLRSKDITKEKFETILDESKLINLITDKEMMDNVRLLIKRLFNYFLSDFDNIKLYTTIDGKRISGSYYIYIINSLCCFIIDHKCIPLLILITTSKIKGVNEISRLFLNMVGSYLIFIYGYTVLNNIPTRLSELTIKNICQLLYLNIINLQYSNNINGNLDIMINKNINLCFNFRLSMSEYVNLYNNNPYLDSDVESKVYNFLLKILLQYNNEYKIINYVTNGYCINTLHYLNNNSRLLHYYSSIVYLMPKEKDANGYINLFRLIGGATLGLNSLIVLTDQSVKYFSTDLISFIKNNNLTKHLTILFITNKHYTEYKKHEFSIDLVLDSRYTLDNIKLDEKNSIEHKLINVNQNLHINNFLNKHKDTGLSNQMLGDDNHSFSMMDYDKDEIFNNVVSNLNVHDNYKLEYLNIENIVVKDLFNKIENFYKNYPNDSLSFILYGESGNGKSMFASYMAKKCDKNLITLSGSSIMSKWVGDSEERIKVFFSNITNNDILLIEEAETLFGNKDENIRKWESSITNEFLVQLERFQGTLLLTTNHYDQIDKTFLRRFNLKLKFLSLTNDSIIKIITENIKTLNFKGNINNINQLEGLRLGDIGIVNKNIKLNNITTVSEYIENLKTEINNRKKKSELGFKLS